MEAVEPWLVEATRRRVEEFCAQLRALPAGVDGTTAVPNLEWTVADLAQHVACLPNYWTNEIAQPGVFEVPDDFAAFSDQVRAHITESDPVALAARIESEYEAFFGDLTEPQRDRWAYGQPITATDLCGLTVSEMTLHGGDLSAVSGAAVRPFSRDEANAAVDALFVSTPVFIDPVKAAAQPDGVYHLNFRGGRDYTWTKQGETLTIKEGRPVKADAHMNADPGMFILSSLGRIGQVRAALSGKLITYGRKPWRFLGLGTIAVDGV